MTEVGSVFSFALTDATVITVLPGVTLHRRGDDNVGRVRGKNWENVFVFADVFFFFARRSLACASDRKSVV